MNDYKLYFINIKNKNKKDNLIGVKSFDTWEHIHIHFLNEIQIKRKQHAIAIF